MTVGAHAAALLAMVASRGREATPVGSNAGSSLEVSGKRRDLGGYFLIQSDFDTLKREIKSA